MTESFIESANVLNNMLFERTGRTKTAEELAQWGIRGGETGYKLQQMAEEYASFMTD
jgi:hypothetical protein